MARSRVATCIYLWRSYDSPVTCICIMKERDGEGEREGGREKEREKQIFINQKPNPN